MSSLLEHDYIGLSEKPSMQIYENTSLLNFNFKETELRLGLPGSQSPERKSTVTISLFGKDLKNSTHALNNVISGTKRGFSDDDDGIVGFDGKGDNTLNTSQSAKPKQDKKNPEVSETDQHASPPSAK